MRSKKKKKKKDRKTALEQYLSQQKMRFCIKLSNFDALRCRTERRIGRLRLQTLRLDNRRSVVGGSDGSRRCCGGLRCAAGAALSYAAFSRVKEQVRGAVLSVIDCFNSRGAVEQRNSKKK